MPMDDANSRGQPPTKPDRSEPSGNRCGHDPSAPRWFEPPQEHEKRPPILIRWIDRVRQFFDKPEKIPSLNSAHHARMLQEDPEHKARQMRSERREACCDLLGAIAHYCDLPTLCLSVPQDDGSLRPVTLKTLADRAGLGLRRAERAIRDIIDAGLLSSHQRAELQPESGTYIGHAAIRVVTPALFGLFGLEEQLRHDRKRLSQKRTKERNEREPTRTEKARLRTAIDGALDKLTGRSSKPKPPPTDAAHFDLERQPGPVSQHIANMKAILTGDSRSDSQPPADGRRDRDQGAQDTEGADTDPRHRGRSRDPP